MTEVCAITLEDRRFARSWLAILVEQSNRNKEDVRKLREDAEKDIAELREEIKALKKNLWPLPAMGVLAGVAGAATGAAALFIH